MNNILTYKSRENQNLCNQITSTCKRIPHKIVTTVFFLTIPVAKYTVSLARKFGLIPAAHTVSQELAPKVALVSDYINKKCQEGVYQSFPTPMPKEFINTSAIISSSCPLQTYLQEVNPYLDQPFSVHSFRIEQIKNPARAVLVYAPIVEEFLFRNIIQGQIFTALPKELIRRLCPDKENLLDSFLAKTGRIVATSLLFSVSHLQNTHLDHIELSQQLVHTFVLGVFCGILKESYKSDFWMDKGDILGTALATALHMTYNFVRCYAEPYFDGCSLERRE